MEDPEFIVGRIGVEEYLEKFMRLSNHDDLPPQPEVRFDKVPLENTRPKEAEMYPYLVHLTSSMLCCFFLLILFPVD